MIIINDPSIWSLEQIKIVETHYHGHYLLETCLKCQNGSWSEFSAAIFYTEIAHVKGSNYFALYKSSCGLTISNGFSAIADPIQGLLIDDVVIYSRFRHDYRIFNGICIDGGRDYFKRGGERIGEAKEINIIVEDGKIYGYFDGKENEKSRLASMFNPSTEKTDIRRK